VRPLELAARAARQAGGEVAALVDERRAVAGRVAAARLEQLAVHVHQPRRPRGLVQVVDVLGAQEEATRAQLALERRQRAVAGVGCHGLAAFARRCA
jgi:hypothetical protein